MLSKHTVQEVEIVQPSAELWTPREEVRRQLVICAKAGGLSHGTDGRFDLDNPNIEKVEDFLRRIAIRKGHESILEHGNATFLIICSRVVSHQLVRHRLSAFTQASSRYIPFKHPAFITPPHIRHWPEPGGPYKLKDIRPIPGTLLNAISSFQAYKNAQVRGINRESARYLLPHCLATKIAMTCNLRNWRHVIRQRTQKAASPEIQDIFNQVKGIFQGIASVLIGDLG